MIHHPRDSAPRLRARLPGREALPRDAAVAAFWAAYPRSALDELADLWEQELTIPFGLLRPDDSLEELLAPFPVGGLRGALSWMSAEAALEDGVSELYYRLGQRRSEMPRTPPRTAVDLVAAWCESAV
jgi:hypothetical protein